MASFLRRIGGGVGYYQPAPPRPGRGVLALTGAFAAAAVFATLGYSLSDPAAAFGQSNAAAAFNAFNAAYLVNSGGQTYYTVSISNRANNGTWTEALDIQGAEDAYESTGTIANQTLVNNLCTTFISVNPPPWSWDGYNDDIGWDSLCLIRGYQMTNNASLLNAAESGFNFAFGRGWDTTNNGGGIWEEQPANGGTDKEALSNDSLCQVALMIYQSTGNTTYLNDAEEIYNWVWGHLFNPSTGQVYTGITPNGTVNTGTALYNQGTFIDVAALLYRITGNGNYLRDAQNAVTFAQNNLLVNGICSNGATYLNTWAPEFARGLGHLVRWNPSLLNTYYSFMTNNANAAWNCRRTDYNVSWNAWTQQTPTNVDVTSNWDVGMVAMLWFTPAVNSPVYGTHSIINLQTGMAIDNGSSTVQGAGMEQWGPNGGPSQKWTFTQNSDTSWNIISAYSGQALDNPGFSTMNGTQMEQWGENGGSDMKWWVDVQSDGSYKIWNQYSSDALDGSSSKTNGYKLIQWGWNGGTQQQWNLINN